MIKSKVEVKKHFFKTINDQQTLVMLCKRHFRSSSDQGPEWSVDILDSSNSRLVSECSSSVDAKELFSYIQKSDKVNLKELYFEPPFYYDEFVYFNNWKQPTIGV